MSAAIQAPAQPLSNPADGERRDASGRGGGDSRPTLCVQVQFPIGSRSYATANADVLTADTLTITDAFTEAILDEFTPTEWCSATVWNRSGVAYSFRNRFAAANERRIFGEVRRVLAR